LVSSHRSWLFVPGNRTDRISKAFSSAADAVIIDLEDACPEAEKVTARGNAAAAAAANPGSRCFVRINSAETMFGLGDLEEVAVAGLAGILLPKAETASRLEAIDWVLGQLEAARGLPTGAIELLPLIETAKGVCNMVAIACCGLPRVRRLTFGAGDFTTDLGIDWSREERELESLRAALVTASRAGGLEPPVDTIWPTIADAEGLGRSLTQARQMGFAGKAVIHPSHVAAANAAFAPSQAAIAMANRVLEAAAAAERDGQGAFQMDGRLMDHVSVVWARRVLAQIGESS
jgi:citrate lyase subunit beta / citryl-CoA lyase